MKLSFWSAVALGAGAFFLLYKMKQAVPTTDPSVANFLAQHSPGVGTPTGIFEILTHTDPAKGLSGGSGVTA